MVQYTLNRKGQFKVYTYGLNHCGAKDGPLVVKYQLKVTCGEGSLDKRGFLFDQTKVDKFFQTLVKTNLSCEQFCVDCSRKLYKQVLKENSGCKVAEMELTLAPFPFNASLTFHYTADEKAASKPVKQKGDKAIAKAA